MAAESPDSPSPPSHPQPTPRAARHTTFQHQLCRSRQRGVWVAALFCTAAWCSLQPASAIQCSVFKPTGCWYTTALPASEEPIVFPRCAFRDCKFNHTAELECPFFTSGTYSVEEVEECEPFMQVTSRRRPTCREACCHGVLPGSWQSPSLSDLGRRDYVPDEPASCSYLSYSRSELLEKLLGEGIDIVVAGDSMMRQHYLNIVQQLRGRRRYFDYRVHTHASFSYCDEADYFTTANYTTDMKQPDKGYLADCIPDFFAPHGDAPPKALATCSRQAGRIDFIHSPLFQSQTKGIEAYMEAMDPKRKLLVVTYVGVWTKATEVPDFLLDVLESVTQRPAGGAVISVGVPTYREVRVPARAAKYRKRNAIMREWVAAHPGVSVYVDYEALSLTANAPPTTANDKHYQCYTTWPRNDEKAYNGLRSKLIGVNTLRDPQFDNPVGNVWMTDDGECYDEMNRNLWAITLNALMQANGLKLPISQEEMPPFIFEREGEQEAKE